MKRFQPAGFFGVPYRCLRLARVLRLLPVLVGAVLLGFGGPTLGDGVVSGGFAVVSEAV